MDGSSGNLAEWALWAVLLIAQNASFTWVSRARNSASLWYHGIASVFSNGLWIVGQFLILNKFMDAKQSGNSLLLIVTCLFYIFFTVSGSVVTHSLLMKYAERGKRKVGA